MDPNQPVTPPSAEEIARRVGELPSPAEAAVAELRQRLEAAKAADLGAELPPVLQEPRDKMDTRYADPPTSHRALVGGALVTAKRAFRSAFQPIINEVMRKQVEFNESILRAVVHLYERQQEMARAQASFRKEVLSRLEALEPKIPSDPPKKPKASRG